VSVSLFMIMAQAAAVATAPIAGEIVPDPVLAEQRGGFQLPNGIEVELSVQTQTSVNGAVLLRTVFQVDRGSPTLSIYAPKQGEIVASATSGSDRAATGTTAPTITYDRNGGLQVIPGTTSSMVSVSGTPVTAGALPAGLTQVASGTVTDAGTIGETATNGTRAVSLGGADLTITHLAGNAFGSAIANSGGDRVIDTQTTLSINLGNAGPDNIGSSMFRVQDIALDAVAMRAN
jgi:hypothetical protein